MIDMLRCPDCGENLSEELDCQGCGKNYSKTEEDIYDLVVNEDELEELEMTD